MSFVRPLVEAHVVVPLAWALVHFLWQGMAIAILLGVILAWLRQRSANARYLACAVAMIVFAAAPVVTLWLRSSPPKVQTSPPRYTPRPVATGERIAIPLPAILEPVVPPPRAAAPSAAVPVQPPPFRFINLFPWLVAAWLAGVTGMSARMFWGWQMVRRWRCRAQPLSGAWPERLRVLQQRLKLVRPVLLLQSALVDSPVTLGCLRAVILLPAGCLTGLTPAQLEVVLLHELIHIRRYDYWANLLQMLVETLLFYHPAVWWVSRRMRQEREHCCDDLAVELSGDRTGYVRALASLESLRGVSAEMGIAASGGSLLARARRLLNPPQPARRRSGWLAGVLLVCLVAGALLAIRTAVRANQENAPDKTAASPAHPVESANLKHCVYQLDWLAFEHAVTNRLKGLPQQQLPRLTVRRFLDSLGLQLTPPKRAYLHPHGALWLTADAEDLARIERGFSSLNPTEGIPVAKKLAEWGLLAAKDGPLELRRFRENPNILISGTSELEDLAPSGADGLRPPPPGAHQVSPPECLKRLFSLAGLDVPVVSTAAIRRSDLRTKVPQPEAQKANGQNGLGLGESSHLLPGPVATTVIVPIPVNQPVAPGETLNIKVAGVTNLSGEFKVQPSGNISYPYLGDVSVGGRTCAELEKILTEDLKDKELIVEPRVSVSAYSRQTSIPQPPAGPSDWPGSLSAFDSELHRLTLKKPFDPSEWSPGYKSDLYLPWRQLEASNDDYSKRTTELNGSITNLQSQIAATETQINESEGDREFLLTELKRLQAEKASLEKQVKNLAFLGEQLRKVRDDPAIARRLESLRPTGGRNRAIVFDDRTGVLVCQATRAELDRVEQVLNVVNQAPPLIDIEVRFAEVELGTLGQESRSGAGFVLTDPQARVALHILEQRPGAKIASLPRVTTINGRIAEVSFATMATNQRSLVVETPDGAQATRILAPRSGPTVLATPSVLLDGNTIRVDLTATVLQSRGFIPPPKRPRNARDPAPAAIPRIEVYRTSKQLTLQDGQTVVFAGLPLDETDKILAGPPAAPTKPIEHSPKKLVIFVTLTIIDPAGNRVHPNEAAESWPPTAQPPAPASTNPVPPPDARALIDRVFAVNPDAFLRAMEQVRGSSSRPAGISEDDEPSDSRSNSRALLGGGASNAPGIGSPNPLLTFRHYLTSTLGIPFDETPADPPDSELASRLLFAGMPFINPAVRARSNGDTSRRRIMFYSYGSGALYIRATPPELELVGKALADLNVILQKSPWR
jgi:beta-lactamase regulating signal transducer with metallopeptidase domain